MARIAIATPSFVRLDPSFEGIGLSLDDDTRAQLLNQHPGWDCDVENIRMDELSSDNILDEDDDEWLAEVMDRFGDRRVNVRY